MKITMVGTRPTGTWSGAAGRSTSRRRGRLQIRAGSDREVPLRHPGVIDQDLPPFVVVPREPVGPILDGDSVIFSTSAATAPSRSAGVRRRGVLEVHRGPKLNVLYAGMMQYDGDTKIPRKSSCAPGIDRTMGEYW